MNFREFLDLTLANISNKTTRPFSNHRALCIGTSHFKTGGLEY